MGDRGTVLIVDADRAIRAAIEGMVDRLGYETLSCERGSDAMEALAGGTPSLAVLEVESTAPNGLQLLCELRDRYASLPVILISATHADSLSTTAGLLLGADDYVEKPFDADELLARIGRLLRASGGENGGAPDAGLVPTLEDELTPRESEILRLLAAGHDQREIAERLVISRKTVGTHIQHVLVKLRVHSRTQAVAEAYRRGLVATEI